MSYDALSRYYDRLMGDFPYQAYVAHMQPQPRLKGLDLGCGTGTVTCLLAKAGMRMHGVDASAEMLNIAMQNARRDGLTVTFGREDMRRFTPAMYDLVCCVSDGLNYLRPADIPPLMQRVYACLPEGGRFVFDVSTPHKLKDVLGNNMYYEDYEDLTYYWQNKWNENAQSVRLDLTFFEKEGEMWRRQDESQVQYAHTRPALEKAAKEAGFTQARVVDGDTFGNVRTGSLRWVFTFTR